MGEGLNMVSFPVINKVLLEQDASSFEDTKKIINRISPAPIHLINRDQTESNGDVPGHAMGKDVLQLISYKGDFLKPCPGTREYICCGYQILNTTFNCPLDCSYCILQAYFNQPNLRVFVNLESELDQVLHRIDSRPDRIFRVGTGEFTDSLALDDITAFSRLIVPPFSIRKNAVLELKTKTDRISNLLSMNYRNRIIVSWSLNSPYIAAREEKRAISLKKRLETARICQSEGFTLAFHFDPMIYYDGWQEGYLKTIELMDQYIDPNRIIWLSLGSFRYMPFLKPIVRKRHPDTCILDGEFVRGLDGKMRYFKPIRIDLYSWMREHLEKWHPSLGLYLCMESDEIWRKSLGWSPKVSDGLKHFLDDRVRRFFGQ